MNDNIARRNLLSLYLLTAVEEGGQVRGQRVRMHKRLYACTGSQSPGMRAVRGGACLKEVFVSISYISLGAVSRGTAKYGVWVALQNFPRES